MKSQSKKMIDEGTGVYAVIIETRTQSPILMETEADVSSLEGARITLKKHLDRSDVIRACIVRLEYEDYLPGNRSLLQSMINLQVDEEKQGVW